MGDWGEEVEKEGKVEGKVDEVEEWGEMGEGWCMEVGRVGYHID